MINKWQNLRLNRCVKCGKTLSFNKDDELVYCPAPISECGFQISQYRMETLVTQMNARAEGKPYQFNRDNFASLQNMGSEEVKNDDEDVLSRLGI